MKSSDSFADKLRPDFLHNEMQKRRPAVDMHNHTTESDGKDSPTGILDLAEKNKLYAVSITDHNKVSAYDNLDTSKFRGLLIPGSELRCRIGSFEIEVLAYGFDIEEMKKKEPVTYYEQLRTMEWRKMLLDRLKSVGRKIGLVFAEDLEADPVLSSHNVFWDNIWEKYNIENKETLHKLGASSRGTFYRGHIQNPESPFYLPETLAKHNLPELCRHIHDAGGCAILAHPFAYKFDGWELVKKAFSEDYGLDGIEIMHREHRRQDIYDLFAFSKYKKLLTSGGSDYHGIDGQIFGNGCKDDPGEIPLDIASKLIDWVAKNGQIFTPQGIICSSKHKSR